MSVRDVRPATQTPSTPQREEPFQGQPVDGGQHFELPAAAPAVLSRTGAPSVTAFPQPTEAELNKIGDDLHPLSYALGVAKAVEDDGQPVSKEFVSWVAECETLKDIHAAGYSTLKEMIRVFSDQIRAA